MPNPIAFQRTGATVVAALTTTTLAGAVSLQVAGYQFCEIVNTSATIAASFSFTTSGATVAATSGDRVIPPLGVLYEQLPNGCASASALELSTGNVSIAFTPGTVRV